MRVILNLPKPSARSLGCAMSASAASVRSWMCTVCSDRLSLQLRPLQLVGGSRLRSGRMAVSTCEG